MRLLIDLLWNGIPVIKAGRPQAARISKQAFTTMHEIRCKEKATEMTPVVIRGAFRILGSIPVDRRKS